MQRAVNSSISLPFGFPETWWQWLLWAIGSICTLLLTIIAIRFTISLDLNALLKARRERQISRIQNACPHLSIDHVGVKTIRVTDSFYSPPGTVMSFCSRCQVPSWNPEREYPGRAEYYLANIDAYLEAEKAFSKLLKKAGYTN